jgi:hypothetical protein
VSSRASRGQSRALPTTAVELKHRWSVSHNYLAGITAGDWWALLRENGFDVDAVYWHRAAVVTALSLVNSLQRRRERRRFDAAIAATEVVEPPLFVLGHWRSGTTHLHNLLAQDTAQFAYANTYQVINPHTFLTTEAVNTRIFAGLVPSRRPMDAMALSFQSPQEDEFAPCLMTGKSPYIGVSFPRREHAYERYLSFRAASADETAAWQAAFLWFLKKLTLKYGRALLLKSPTHTARVRLLLEMFPNARFVHIHRHPYEVFQSFQHYYDTAVWYTYLQRPDRGAVDQRILSRYTELHDALFDDLPRIPDGRFHELRFDDLERDPLGQMATLYERLGLADFARCRPQLAAYLSTLSGYERNAFPPLAPALRERVAREWRRSFDRWGYRA